MVYALFEKKSPHGAKLEPRPPLGKWLIGYFDGWFENVTNILLAMTVKMRQKDGN